MPTAGSIDIVIPGYKIVGALGQGGMASVYLAVQENFGREVALKLVSQRYKNDESFSTRFMREARIVAQMRHSNIVSVYDVGNYQGQLYLSMELLEGGDLKSRIGSGMKEVDAARICIAIASALSYAHAKGFLHRDIKPENVLFRSDGTPVITDFGIARALETSDSMTQSGVLVGTPSYMSPEQARGEPVDQRTDIYSLGVLFYELLTGAVPFKATSAVSTALKHISDPIPRLPEPLTHWNPFLERILAKHADERFSTCRDVMSALAFYANITDIDGGSQTLQIDSGEMARLIDAINIDKLSRKKTNVRKKGRNTVMSGAALFAVALLVLAVVRVFYVPENPQRLTAGAPPLQGSVDRQPEPLAAPRLTDGVQRQNQPLPAESAARVETVAVAAKPATSAANTPASTEPKPFAAAVNPAAERLADLALQKSATVALEKFKASVEARDLTRVKSAAVLSPENERLLVTLFENYSGISLQLASVSSVVKSDQLQARFYFSQLRNTQGQFVEAGERWKYFDVLVRRSNKSPANGSVQVVW